MAIFYSYVKLPEVFCKNQDLLAAFSPHNGQSFLLRSLNISIWAVAFDMKQYVLEIGCAVQFWPPIRWTCHEHGTGSTGSYVAQKMRTQAKSALMIVLTLP